MMLEAIDRRLHNEMALQASFHGISVPRRERVVEEPETQPIDPDFEKRYLERVRKRLKHG